MIIKIITSFLVLFHVKVNLHFNNIFLENTQNLQNILDELVRDEERHREGNGNGEEADGSNDEEAAASSDESEDDDSDSEVLDVMESNSSDSDSSGDNMDYFP